MCILLLLAAICSHIIRVLPLLSLLKLIVELGPPLNIHSFPQQVVVVGLVIVLNEIVHKVLHAEAALLMNEKGLGAHDDAGNAYYHEGNADLEAH